MKIDRPKRPTPTAPSNSGEVDGPAKAGRSRTQFADKLAGGPGGPGGPSGPSGPSGSGTDPVAAIARRLEAGEITPNEAVDEVIAAASDSAVLAEVPAAVRDDIAKRLADLVGNDPFLTGKATRVGAMPDGDE